MKTHKSLGILRNIENFDHNSVENDDFEDAWIWKPEMPVRNLLEDDNSLPREKKNWVESWNSQIFGCFKNIENFDHNSSENDDFDNGQIWKPEMPV